MEAELSLLRAAPSALQMQAPGPSLCFRVTRDALTHVSTLLIAREQIGALLTITAVEGKGKELGGQLEL